MLFVVIVAAFLALVFGSLVDWWRGPRADHGAAAPTRTPRASTFGNPSAVLTVVALLAVPVVATASGRRKRGVARRRRHLLEPWRVRGGFRARARAGSHWRHGGRR